MRRSRFLLGLLFASALTLGGAGAVQAAGVAVAVAANFSMVADELGAAFKAKTGNDVVISAGATGALYTQITQAAPFEVFLSADSKTPKKAIDEGFGVAGTQFTYAIGKIVLFSTDPALVTGEETLKTGTFEKLAIADPETAPYGAAAVAAMTALGVCDTLKPKIVTGESIAQTYQFVDTGNAELGFVALSQIIKREDGSRWEVPAELYKPLTQDAVLLKAGEANQAAKDFLDFLKSPDAVALIASYGYGVHSELD
jgi:molybdate transport system substrate-binding protein